MRAINAYKDVALMFASEDVTAMNVSTYVLERNPTKDVFARNTLDVSVRKASKTVL